MARGSAAGWLAALAVSSVDVSAAITAASAVPALVELLEPGYSSYVQINAAGCLANIASSHAPATAAVAAAGAIPSLLRLMGPGSPPQLNLYAARALRNLNEHGQSVPATVLSIAERFVTGGR
ncbi:hypothetical protein FOA52_012456 [Chlamydomonas sp. UWO 241]|nr:hypothetical protein FOA52_012456 [Chlamydomonas sp. UWO 241]